MADLSQSAFLQALGWATISSFWQMGLLWCCFAGLIHSHKISPGRKYTVAVSSIAAGFVWFLVTFVLAYKNGVHYNLSVFNPFAASPNYMPSVLAAASVTYLLLIVIPSYRLIHNWRYVQQLKKSGLLKANVQHKIFVKKIAALLGIKKPVKVFLSALVKSPVTIGYIRPIILLPLASFNNLSLQQVEAVLLHELSHIRRYDYLVNILISIAHTFLYFNPFVKLFVRVAEEERENCCDQLVLQFGYDRVSYASALLHLEKLAVQAPLLTIGAVGRKKLLSRIERIVGIDKKPLFSFNNFAGFVAALLCIFALNSIVITTKEKLAGNELSFNGFTNPFYISGIGGVANPLRLSNEEELHVALNPTEYSTAYHTPKEEIPTDDCVTKWEEDIEDLLIEESTLAPESNMVHVALNEVETALSATEKQELTSTIQATKKVLSSVQWKEVESSIGDALTEGEKEAVRREYINEVEKIDWQNFEKTLKAGYAQIDWQKINLYLNTALTEAKLDSLQKTCEQLMLTIKHAETKLQQLPFPDESVAEIEKRKQELRIALKEVKERRKKIVQL